MTDKKWRDHLDLLVENNLNELIKETKEFDYAISNAKNKGKAQLWVALAIINNKLNNINMKDKNKNYQKKVPKKEIEQILNTLETL